MGGDWAAQVSHFAIKCSTSACLPCSCHWRKIRDQEMHNITHMGWDTLDFRMYKLNCDAVRFKENNIWLFSPAHFVTNWCLQIFFCLHIWQQNIGRECLHLANLWLRLLFVCPPQGHPAKDFLFSDPSSMNSSTPRRYHWLHQPKIRPVWSYTPLRLVHTRSCPQQARTRTLCAKAI